jgi:uncharacterized LabA/DUF88 family protein
LSRPVIFFVDYENLRYTPQHAFGCSPIDFDPLKLALLLPSRRNVLSVVKEVRVYRGIARAEMDDGRASKDMSRVDRWRRDKRVVPVVRPLQYGMRDGVKTSFEKGIDVALAVDLIRHAHSNVKADAIVVSRDSDLSRLWRPLWRLIISRDELKWCRVNASSVCDSGIRVSRGVIT